VAVGAVPQVGLTIKAHATTAALAQPMALAEQLLERERHRWSRAEYERMAAAGVLEPDVRLELIDGEVLRMPPQSTRHFTAIRLAEQRLGAVFTAGHDVRSQGPLALDGHSEPEPDIAVVRGSPRDYADNHPVAAVLILEIADSSLGFDRIAKKRLYARNGVPEYWILDLNGGALEVYRDPKGDDFLSKQTIGRDGGIAPLAAPDTLVAVADLLP
jgi:Uma2 family endonuclease